MLGLCSILLPCHYAQNNASIKCQSLEGLAEFQTITSSRFSTPSPEGVTERLEAIV